MVSMWPCNFSVKLPSKVIMPKRKRKNKWIYNNEDSVVQTFMMEFRARNTFWYSFGFSYNLLPFLFGLSYCWLLRRYHFYTDLFTNLFSMSSFRHCYLVTWIFFLVPYTKRWMNFIGPLVHCQFIYIKYSIANIHVMFYFPNS